MRMRLRTLQEYVGRCSRLGLLSLDLAVVRFNEAAAFPLRRCRSDARTLRLRLSASMRPQRFRCGDSEPLTPDM
jgi:hypothetical protein